MLELLQENLKWLQNALKLEDFKTIAILAFCNRSGFFEFLENEKSAEEVAEHFKLDLKFVRALLYFLRSKNLISGEEKFKITETSKILFKRDSCLTITDLIEEKFLEIFNWLDFQKVLSGQAKREEEFFRDRIISLGKFSLVGDIKIVSKVAELEEFKKARKLLDLGGGHGLYSYAFTLLNKNLKAYVFDLPEVVAIARDFMANLKADRVEFIAGDFFKDDIGSDYDLVFSSFNPGGKRAELIPKIYRSLNPGGIYVNRQFFPIGAFELRDLEWNLWSFEKLRKDIRAFTFEGDLDLSTYLSELEKIGFKIVEVLKDDFVLIVAKKHNR